ncbi:MAG: DUF4339 domain-containing protein [Chthoniobacter sp.]|nr:DUF4339 domain-containing protein [Chthoniobacter sp.]
MDIYILRDGKEIGPFNEETTKTLLQQGSIVETDYAWHPGLPKWLPLATVLKPVPPPLDTPPPPPPPAATRTELPTFANHAQPAADAEPASDRQKALLKYLGIPYTSTLTKDQAALLVNETMEDPKKAGLLVKWNTDRLKLRPDLFAAELQEQKEARAGEYFEVCQTEGAEYFTKITKAHCQVLIGFLDGKFPNWDEDAHTAPKNYFFPAVAEKFPQLVAREWKGKLHYATPAAGADEKAGKPPVGKSRKRKAQQGFPVVMIGRAAVFAALAIAMFLFVKKLNSPAPTKPPAPTAQPSSPQTENPIAPAPGVPKAEEVLPDKGIAQVDPFNPPVEPAAPTPPAAPVDPADPLKDPKMATDPAAPKPAEPVPGFPPDPLAPAPTPAAGDPPAPTPAPPPTADPFAPTPSPTPAPPATPAEPVAPKSVLKLTKAVEVQLAYGKMKLPVGTSVKFISQEGAAVKVSYLNTVLTIPSSSTDFGVAEVAPPASAPVAVP